MNAIVNNLYPVPNHGSSALKLAAGSTPVSFGDFDSGTRYVLLDITGGDAIVTFDGSAPASGNGHVLKKGQIYTWSKQAAQAARFVQSTSTKANIYASQFTN